MNLPIEAITKIGNAYLPVTVLGYQAQTDDEVYYRVTFIDAPWIEDVLVKQEDIYFKKLIMERKV